MRNGAELSNLEHLLTNTQNAKYLWNAEARTSRLFWPFKLHNVRFKKALDHKKRWRIEQFRVSTHQNIKCEISPERKHAHLSFLWAL